MQCIEAIQRGAPQVEGPMFIPGEYNGDKEGYQYSTKGPKGEGYYKDFREQLRALGYRLVAFERCVVGHTLVV